MILDLRMPGSSCHAPARLYACLYASKFSNSDSRCIYHSMFHKIITVGIDSAEWYDINQDKSMIITQYKDNKYELGNLWYSSFDPNILYTTNVESLDVYKMGLDLRNGEVYYEKVYTPPKEKGVKFCLFVP